MPFSSKARMRVASVNRAGGCVKCWSLERLLSLSPSPSFKSGNGD